MRKHLFFVLDFLALSTLFFAGCQKMNTEALGADERQNFAVQENSTKAEHTVIEPEALISLEEAQQLLGKEITETSKQDNDVVGQKICFYDAAGDDINGFLQISITQDAFMANEDTPSAEAMYTATKEMFGEEAVKVPGLGDDAFLATGGYYILYHGYFLSIYSGNTDNAEVVERLGKAGDLAVRNLEALLQ